MQRRSPPRSSGSTATLHLDPAMPMPSVAVAIGTRRYVFGLDTGAMGFARVSSQLVADCSLVQTGKAHISDPSGMNAHDVALWRLPSLTLGNIRFDEFDAEQENHLPAGLSGILGLDLFAGIILGLDHKNERLILNRGSLPEPDGKRSFQSRSGPVLRLPVTIEGNHFEADIDTGQGVCPLLVSPDWATRIGMQRDNLRTTTGHTVSQAIPVMIAPNSKSVKVGDISLPVDSIGWPTPTPMPNLGWQAFVGLHLEIDRQNNRCRFV